LKYWFTADHHFGHSNIIKYCNRPFKNIGEHDYKLIRLWNSRVKEEDIVYYLGDFCFKSLKDRTAKYYIDQLNGKIIFIRGNHDTNNGVKTNILDIRIIVGKKNYKTLLLVHNPMDIGYSTVDLLLCGHVHNLWKFTRFKNIPFDICNVGVDVWNYMPISINEIFREYNKWKKSIQNK
jgi:calcineurin-like phosphoesterase family protein